MAQDFKQSLKWLPVYALFMTGLTAALFALQLNLAQVNCGGMAAYLENKLACTVRNNLTPSLALVALVAMVIPLVSRRISHARIGALFLLPMLVVLFSEVVVLVRVDCTGDAWFLNEFYCEFRAFLACLIPLVMAGTVALARVFGNYYREIRQSVETTS
ncbi:MAG: hypothetical protein OXI52_10245 [Caldilineaceae bacterium]|nr:hypothetical protein [Caldilineaceae bacterium]